ncbi:MAG: nucleotide exchange factor GrpE [Desulfobacteraceae bacterium]|jgi:molecular chaperone GrpE
MTEKDKIRKYEKTAEATAEETPQEKPVDLQDEKPPEGGSQTSETDVIAELEKKLEAARQEAQANYDRLLRTTAEFENYKKRSARELQDFRKYANETLLKELLPVVDNLELAVKTAREDGNGQESLADGIDLTLKEILRVLNKFGVQAVEALNQPFDPVFHQAVVGEESDKHPKNTVIQELQKGYTLHDRLLRPSMVVVAKPRAEGGPGQPEENE